MNDNKVLPFISEQCINPWVLPSRRMHGKYIHQLGEVLFAVGVTAEEPRIYLGRPNELSSLLAATIISLEAIQNHETNHSLVYAVTVAGLL